MQARPDEVLNTSKAMDTDMTMDTKECKTVDISGLSLSQVRELVMLFSRSGWELAGMGPAEDGGFALSLRRREDM